MKDLTQKELFEAPELIQRIYFRGLTKEPISSDWLNEAIENHPEYFQEEIEASEKWAVIPQSVHDEYWRERREIEDEIMKHVPPSKGIMWSLQNPDEYAEWYKAWKDADDKMEPIRERLHKKFYSKYGIKWNGW